MPRDQTVWFAMIDGTEAGPMTRGEFALRMATDRVTEETFVWKEGMSEWLPAARVKDLAPMFRVKAKKKVVRPPPPPAAALAKSKPAPVQHVEEEEIALELDTPISRPAPQPALVPDPPVQPTPLAPPPAAPPEDEEDDS